MIDRQLFCSFCMSSHADVRYLAAGLGVTIWDRCVHRCAEIMDQAPPSGEPVPPPVSERSPMTDEQMLIRLPRLSAVAQQVEQGLREWVDELRRRGVTWSWIGASLAMTRQSAWTRLRQGAEADVASRDDDPRRVSG